MAMARLIAITDPGDPRIEAYRHVKERDLVGRQGRFVAEGEVVLRAAIRSGRHVLDSLLLAEKRVAAMAPLLANLPGATPAYVASQVLLDTIVGFEIHRGILALGAKAADPGAEALLAGLPDRALVLLLSGIGNHDNMGGIFRNAAAFGVDAVLIDSDCCDPYYRKAIRVSVGGVLGVPFARLAPGVDALALLERHAIEAVALSPAGEQPLNAYRPAPRTAMLLGAEGPGLAADILNRARTVRIEMSGGFDSLNVATTAGIALHHLVAAARA